MTMVKDFPDWSGPMVEPILKLHRGADGYVRFLKKDRDGNVGPITSVKAIDLDGMFPSFVDELVRDAYFTVNSFWRGNTHASKDASYLNACYTDLDFGKEDDGVRFGQALKVVTRLQDEGIVPPASIITRSGTGAWLFWILNDEKDIRIPQSAFAEKQAEYMAVQRALNERIRAFAPELNPDAGALDVSRVTRVPGSMNSGAKRRVSYVAQFDDTVPPRIDWEDGFAWLRAPLFTYSLRELREYTGVDARPRPEVTRTKSTGKAPKRINGWNAVKERRFAEFQKLEAYRGGFREGHRHLALWVAAYMMREQGWDEERVEHEIELLARRCQPPLRGSEWRDALRDSLEKEGKRRWMRDETLVEKLLTTPEETEALGLHHLRHDAKWKPFIPKGAKAKRDHRLEALAELLVKFGMARPTVEQVRHVLAEQGITASGATIWKDAQEVGFDFKRAKPGPVVDQGALF